jgi:hypothetical protein
MMEVWTWMAPLSGSGIALGSGKAVRKVLGQWRLGECDLALLFERAFRERVCVNVGVKAQVAGVEANNSFGIGSAIVQELDDGLGRGFSPLSSDGYECAIGDDEVGVEVKMAGCIGLETKRVLFWYITEL